jgi:hypothetical protein
MNYDAMTDHELAVEAARRMYGPALAHTPDGAPMYGTAMTGRIVRGLTLEFAHELLLWTRGAIKEPINYVQSTKVSQHLSAAEYDKNGNMLHPVGQVWLYHSQIIIGHVIAAGKIFDCISIDRARAEMVACLKATNGA